MYLQAVSSDFYQNIKILLAEARQKTYRSINFIMVETYWNIGRMIIEEEQNGKQRAEYGKYLITELSKKLTDDFGKGFDSRNLWFMRQFYLTYPIMNTLCSQLSWSHNRLIMKIQNPKSREYYLQEAIEQQWSFRQLERQVSSFYYERVLASKDKELVKSEVNQNAVKIDAREIIKDPFVLEFLDIAENTNYLEKDLEQAIIDKLQLFMLELGKGFAFVARQKRISTEAGKHYYIDLVFYNYILKCFVLIDLKVGTLTPQDVGQMDMYVRMYEKIIRQHNDNPTIGIILCSQNDKTVVEFSVLEENKQLFASQYQLYLPTKEQLIAEIERNIENL